VAAGPDESDRRPLDAIALDALAELRRLFQADAPSTAASEEAAGELLAAAGRIARAARTDAAPFEPIDAIEALVRAQAPPLEPLAFSLDGLRQPGAAEPGRRASGAPAADGAGLRLPASDLLSAAAEQKGMSEEELVAYLEAIGPNAALLAELRALVFTLDRASARALLALLAAIATLTRELSDGALRKTLLSLGVTRLGTAADDGARRPGSRTRRRLRL